MPITIKRKEPKPEELPIEWVETPGESTGLQVRFFIRSVRDIGVQYNNGDGDESWGIGSEGCRFSMSSKVTRELANALLKMADQIEGK